MSIQTRTTALQNEIVRLYFTFEKDGKLANPVGQPVVEIIDTDGVTVLGRVMASVENLGIYYADWYVPANLPIGEYYDRWTFQWDASSSSRESTCIFQVHSMDTYINFVNSPIDHKLSDRAVQLLKDLANDFIYEAQHIPIYWEHPQRTQQENRNRRIKDYYTFNVLERSYWAEEGAIYSDGVANYTVFTTLNPIYESSSSESTSYENSTDSSSSSESILNLSSSSSSGVSDSSLSTSSESSESSSTSSSIGSSHSSSSSSYPVTTTTTTTPYIYQPTLVTVGLISPVSASGTLTLISGEGSPLMTYTSYTVKESRFSTIYNFAYQNWNHDPKPLVRVNSRLIDDGWYADYMGNIYFDGIMTLEDAPSASYNFAYFSTEELLAFLRMGLCMMNATPPASTTYSSFETMPAEWNCGVLLYAGIMALKRLIFGLSWQEKRIIYRDPVTGESIANDAASQWQSLYQSYNELWLEFKKDVKTRKLPGISMSIQPEYTLPGGRCMSFDTLIKCEVNGDYQCKTVESLFDDFNSGKDIKVMAYNGGLVMAEVSKIWDSGDKLTYILSTKHAYIRLTEEHLVYDAINNIYKPVKDFKRDDTILVNIDDSVIEEKLLSDPVEYEIERVYDIEVPSVNNFIGNGIVSHNSRFFRYLYKSM